VAIIFLTERARCEPAHTVAVDVTRIRMAERKPMASAMISLSYYHYDSTSAGGRGDLFLVGRGGEVIVVEEHRNTRK